MVHKWVHYFDVYHTHFKRFRNTECIVLEIGVSMGGSLQMWKDYFGDKAKIYGLDINPNCKAFEEENIGIFIGSQSDREFLSELKTRIPKIDILIDDGGHRMAQQIISFEELFDHISDDGVYLCEDTHTSYWDEYGGGFRKPESFIEFSKTLIDKLNAWHIRDNILPVSEFTRNVGSLHYYDSIFVLEKKTRVGPWHETRGKITPLEINENKYSVYNLYDLKMNLLGIPIPDNSGLDVLRRNSFNGNTLLSDKFEGKVWPETGETMIGYQRLNNIEFCIQEIIRNQIGGDLIETGVWRGGACIFMRAMLQAYGVTNKNVWVADSFEGLPKPNPASYPADLGDTLYTFRELAVSVEEVRKNFDKYNLLDDQVIFLKGWFKDSLPTAKIQKLALLRIDGDMYESTIDVLYHLYPKLSTGGYCIIDDWGAIPACKKAVDDFRRVYNIAEEIQIIDWTGIFWKKDNEVQQILRSDFDKLISKFDQR